MNIGCNSCQRGRALLRDQLSIVLSWDQCSAECSRRYRDLVDALRAHSNRFVASSVSFRLALVVDVPVAGVALHASILHKHWLWLFVASKTLFDVCSLIHVTHVSNVNRETADRAPPTRPAKLLRPSLAAANYMLHGPGHSLLERRWPLSPLIHTAALHNI